MNILVSGKNIPVSVLELFDFQGQLADGGEKYETFIQTRFIEHIIKIDPHKTITYVVMFDGASNIQIGGEPLEIHYPKISVMRGVERTVSLFLNDFPISQL